MFHCVVKFTVFGTLKTFVAATKKYIKLIETKFINYKIFAAAT